MLSWCLNPAFRGLATAFFPAPSCGKLGKEPRRPQFNSYLVSCFGAGTNQINGNVLEKIWGNVSSKNMSLEFLAAILIKKCRQANNIYIYIYNLGMVYSTHHVDDLGMVTGWFIYRFGWPQTIDAFSAPCLGQMFFELRHAIDVDQHQIHGKVSWGPRDPWQRTAAPRGGIEPIEKTTWLRKKKDYMAKSTPGLM